jgi:hypothetical protein
MIALALASAEIVMNSEFVEPIGFSFVRDLRAQVFQPFHDFSGKFFEFVKVHRSDEALRVDLRFKYPNATRAAVGRGIAGKRGFSN